MHIRFLGTSGHGVTKSRNLPSALIDSSLLLDCGEGTLNALIRLNIPIHEIKVILISHLHGDHFLGLISVLWQLAFYSYDIKPTPKSPLILVPNGMKKYLEQVFMDSFSPFKNVGFIPNIQELSNNMDHTEITTKYGTYLVKWIQTTHNPICYAYRFNDIITFSGDTGICPELSLFTKGCSILVHEASFPDSYRDLAHKANHSTPFDAASIARESGVKILYLYHLPNLPVTQERDFIKDAEKNHGSIHILHDNDEIEIKS